MSKEVIGIIGTTGAGKDTAGDHVADTLSIPSFQTSSYLKRICAETGVEPTRQNLIELGTKLSKEHGDGYLIERLLDEMPDHAIMTGIRQLGQIAVLRSSSALTLLSIDADPAIRFERATKRAKLGEAGTLDAFISQELAENSAPNTQRVFECMEEADYSLTNNAGLEELYAQLDKIFAVQAMSSL